MDFSNPNAAIAMTMNWVLSAYKFFKDQTEDDSTAMQLTDIWWASMIDALIPDVNPNNPNNKEE